LNLEQAEKAVFTGNRFILSPEFCPKDDIWEKTDLLELLMTVSRRSI
jgi:hypothetical protein